MENEGKEEGSACVSRAVVGVPPSTSSPDTQTEYCREKAQEIAKWGLVFLYYNSAKSCFVNKIFAAKERKEHIDKNLCCLFFCDLCDLLWQFIFACGVSRAGPFALLGGYYPSRSASRQSHRVAVSRSDLRKAWERLNAEG